MHPTIVMLMILDYSKSQRDSFHRHKDLTQMLRQNILLIKYTIYENRIFNRNL